MLRLHAASHQLCQALAGSSLLHSATTRRPAVLPQRRRRTAGSARLRLHRRRRRLRGGRGGRLPAAALRLARVQGAGRAPAAADAIRELLRAAADKRQRRHAHHPRPPERLRGALARAGRLAALAALPGAPGGRHRPGRAHAARGHAELHGRDPLPSQHRVRFRGLPRYKPFGPLPSAALPPAQALHEAAGGGAGSLRRVAGARGRRRAGRVSEADVEVIEDLRQLVVRARNALARRVLDALMLPPEKRSRD
mmetsp:Transcript_122096/g.380093  ORF Transcript_122096/g.380093 Transcript_122096/m.380093 type:complete len:252 (+) Transcript_122096:965-1720(+)